MVDAPVNAPVEQEYFGGRTASFRADNTENTCIGASDGESISNWPTVDVWSPVLSPVVALIVAANALVAGNPVETPLALGYPEVD